MPSPTPRIVLVTGAAAGIGLATARAFAAAGDIVVLTDLSAAAVEAHAGALGEPHIGLAMDVSDEAAVVACMVSVAARFGRIDVLINNAGIVDPDAGKVLDKSLDDVRRLIAVNLEGTCAVAREAGRVMLAQGSGSIVNLSSGSVLGALPGRTPYSMTKAAILGFTRALASEWAGRGVRVNAVLPGYVRTEILASLERAGKFDPRQAGTAVPLGRLAEPAEIAAAILHVAGAEYVTGASFLADGGYAAFGGRGAASSEPVSGHVPDGTMLVIGGASGAGAAIADRYAATGAKVVVAERDTASLTGLPADRVGIALDITDEDAVEAAVRGLATTFGPIAILVHDIARSSTDLIGTLTIARAAARAMIDAGGGAIVHVSSLAGPTGEPGIAWHASQEGMRFLTKSLACEWAPHNIRVNAVEAGDIAPADIADAVLFLASDAASYVTGTRHIIG